MNTARIPVGIVSEISKAHLVRQVALELKMSYEELPVPERPDLIRFSFPPMDKEQSLKLAMSVPREAYAYQAVFVGSTDPRELKL